MDVSVGTRLRVLRKDAGVTQAQLAALAGTNQAAINRYETDRAAAPYRILIWHATYFNVSLDYIFSLCDDPRGRYKNNAVSSGSGRYSIFFAIKIIRLTASGL